ncbi:phosphoethanolamine transferase [Pseudoxanthomonas helianthi]|uniref:Phosphoethanolamine transferase n=1 Tax=Pseudoxanthomonas helianthi TaxID=1453541 RepID=A0A940X338_9GAMM|nr:phosphoethanolamine--lipid A transferase [Pseudoxanthomonas helianthi]MBP3983839.1 phosphoethanolamine transferase [Pseudoxanthomonas helianthi]
MSTQAADAATWRTPTGAMAWLRRRPVLSTDVLVLLTSLYFTVFCNGAFWRNAIVAPSLQWKLALALFVVVTALHTLLLGVFTHRWFAKPLLTVLILAVAAAAHFMSATGVYLDPDMIGNVIRTDFKESHELFTWSLLVALLLALVPIALLWRVQLKQRPWRRALLSRLGLLAGALAALALAAFLSYQDLSSLLRNHREIRYLITPYNLVVSTTQALTATPPGSKKPKLPVGEDAKQAARAPGAKPRLLVIVVGETARAMNWGLNGYARDTTPELRKLDVVNFPDVTSCGSATEVSLPCMFSPYGRHDYDQGRIREHQSLLHVLERAGIKTGWRDNQTGCKGVCDGLAFESLENATVPQWCSGERCFDEVLLDGLDKAIAPGTGDRVVVLHPLGNHGPSYYQRYPPQFERFTPTCKSDDLGRCDRQGIVNAYDNALLYQDHFLARTIAGLQGRSDYDTALIYVSDHGESLGEKGLYLHGVPYAIAPREQVKVPMVMWFSPGFASDTGLDTACLRREAAMPASHDNLFPSVLGLMDVRTKVYDASRDLFARCRAAPRS